MERESLYWDNFKVREKETIEFLRKGLNPPVRRVAIFITNKCNFRCEYCRSSMGNKTMEIGRFDDIVKKYGETSIIHITGGEPSCVPWLYEYIDSHSGYRFNLNTNCYLEPPRNIKRLKVSLDSFNKDYFNSIVKKDAFDAVCNNIAKASEYTVVSVTCTLTADNYREAPEFMRFCRGKFPKIYAVFFSIYKGDNPKFVFTKTQSDEFFNYIKPILEKEMDEESLALFNETIDEKRRIVQGIRFPENLIGDKCYLALSERVFDWDGNEYHCSHMFRDGQLETDNKIHKCCLYGCNRRLVKFNEDIHRLLGEK